ncbi:MAG: hypothetical protein K1X74_00105 [Pirellulales bacterium]|nr:hypothetical protein [Pirellulales bacterium]
MSTGQLEPHSRWSCGMAVAGLIFAAAIVLALLAPRSPAKVAVVRGSVTGQAGPIAGARVRFAGDGHLVLTDAAGQFSLPRVDARQMVTAALPGYVIAGAIVSAQPSTAQSVLGPLVVRPVPDLDHADYAWVDPRPSAEQQQNCGNCHRGIYDDWSKSGHARAATNHHFKNVYDGTDATGQANRGWNLLAEHPEGAGVCTACHAPGVAAGTTAYDDLRAARSVDALGVHCDFCHKVAAAPEVPLGRTHGRYGLELRRPAEGQLFFGPWDDVARGEDVYTPLFTESRYCASCHEGVVFGTQVYGTYSEYLDSPAARAGKQCQDCHMAPTGQVTNIAPGKGGLARDPRTISDHRFPAATAARLRAALGVEIAWQVGETRAQLEITLAARDVGHSVPTGFIDRNLVLVVAALDEHGQPLDREQGAELPELAGAEIQGRCGVVLAKQLRGPQGEQPVPFWQPQELVADTRLHPAQPQTHRWSFTGVAARLHVQLVYRRFWPATAAEKAWNDNEELVFDESFVIAATGRRTLGTTLEAPAP